MEPRITVVVVDDHPLFRDGVVHTLSARGKFEVVGEGATAAEAVRLVAEMEPDILLLDMHLPGGGLQAIETIFATETRTNILMLTVDDDEESMVAAFSRGVRGYLLKGAGCNELMETIRSISRGERYVSPQLIGKLLGQLSSDKASKHGETVEFTGREEQILNHLSRGLSNKEIAFRLELSEKTVKYYLTGVLKKLGVRNRVEAALYASHRVDRAPAMNPR